ncbi:ergothioneine biosynthesis protein EgtC [Sphaerisporangium rubeum]|uniref:Glutamine amidotransferase n=1 Tax=Sphaerisporangium rubeum TaxID=321317 RepID=A0A7X0M792_9ACTN|nr:glutamine amidotransferase [Sphaerisporangium rubeum]
MAWVGAPRTLATLLDGDAGLIRQSYAPRLQRHGAVNADGFGAGWYAPRRAEPVRYRRAVPIWTDANLPGLAAVAASGCMVAAVRSATAGSAVEESSTAPFTHGPWLLSHNGRVAPPAVRPLLRGLDPESGTDSAWLAAAVFARLAAGTPLAEAVAEVVTLTAAADPAARLNLIVADGGQVAATAWGDTLFVHLTGGVLIASEPLDHEEGWRSVPDRHLVHATPDGVVTSPLAIPVTP